MSDDKSWPEKQKEKGLVYKGMWIKPELWPQVKEFVRKLERDEIIGAHEGKKKLGFNFKKDKSDE